MTRDGRDPVAARSADSEDLYGVADWEVRTAFDRLVYWLYYGFYLTVRVGVVLAAVAILAAQFVLGGLGAVADPVLGVFTVLRRGPGAGAGGLRLGRGRHDAGAAAPAGGDVRAGCAVRQLRGRPQRRIGDPIRNVASLGGAVPCLARSCSSTSSWVPSRETVKLLAVRLFAFRSDRFDAVVDRAVYGAVAGLGFATIENALYITQNADAGLQATNALTEAGGIAVVRTLAGPGHVIYSAFAGYYLGLAKFNPRTRRPHRPQGPRHRGVRPRDVQHAGRYRPRYRDDPDRRQPAGGVFGFVVVYDSVFGLLLIRKIRAYARAYRNANPSPTSYESEPTEFDP